MFVGKDKIVHCFPFSFLVEKICILASAYVICTLLYILNISLWTLKSYNALLYLILGIVRFERTAIMRGFHWTLRNQHKRALLYYSYCTCNMWGVYICIYCMYGNINIWLSLCFVMGVVDIRSLMVAQHALNSTLICIL
jgi:hypothetical protein